MKSSLGNKRVLFKECCSFHNNVINYFQLLNTSSQSVLVFLASFESFRTNTQAYLNHGELKTLFERWTISCPGKVTTNEWYNDALLCVIKLGINDIKHIYMRILQFTLICLVIYTNLVFNLMTEGGNEKERAWDLSTCFTRCSARGGLEVSFFRYSFHGAFKKT